jgi:hypothetical protein
VAEATAQVGATAAPGTQTVGSSSGTAPAPQVTAAAGTVAPTSGATASLEQEITAAYLRFWQVRSDALFVPDDSRLPEVMAGPALEREREQIGQLRAKGQAAKIVVEHHITFVSIAPTNAELYDEYENKSFPVDAQTKQPIGTPGPGGIAKVSYVLQKIDGTWKVVDGAVHE